MAVGTPKVEPAAAQLRIGPAGGRRSSVPFPDELEHRIRALESPLAPDRDFDAWSWWWIGALGIAVPVLLLVIGWWL